MHRKKEPRKKALVLVAVVCMVLMFVAVLIHDFFPSRFPVWTQTISEIVSNPAAWDNRTVRVEGIIQRTSLGIILPFDFWLSDPENQTTRIGVKWHSEVDLSGKHVNVFGVIRKGYAWVHPDYPGWRVYFIDANLIY